MSAPEWVEPAELAVGEPIQRCLAGYPETPEGIAPPPCTLVWNHQSDHAAVYAGRWVRWVR